jgi:hypothetical protein
MSQSYWNIEEYIPEDLGQYNVTINRTGIVYYVHTGAYVTDVIGKKGLFVLTSDGRLRVGSNLHHSDLTHGYPVRCAGMITFSKNGKIKTISNKSGHFLPQSSCLEDVLDWIKAYEVDTDSIQIKKYKL